MHAQRPNTKRSMPSLRTMFASSSSTPGSRPSTSTGVGSHSTPDENERMRRLAKRSMPSLKALFSSQSTVNFSSQSTVNLTTTPGSSASSSNAASSPSTSPPPDSSSGSLVMVTPSQITKRPNPPVLPTPPSSPSFRRLKHHASRLLLRSSASRTSMSNKRYTPSLPAELWLLILRFACMPPCIKPGSDGTEVLIDPFDPFYSSLLASAPSQDCDDDDENAQKCFLTTPSSTLLHKHFTVRLSAYDQLVKWKAGLCRVSKEWRDVAQVVLWEDVWIGRGREGRRVAGRLGGDAGVLDEVVVVSAGREKEKAKDKAKAKRGLKSLFRRECDGPTTANSAFPNAHRPTHTRSPTTLSRLSTTSSLSHSSRSTNPGTYIKRLHIETQPLDKCSPHDLLLILQHCPNLEVFEDWRSVRRAMFRLVVGGDERVPFEESMGAFGVERGNRSGGRGREVVGGGEAKTDAILYALLYPGGSEGRTRPLKRVCWTNYDYDVGDFERGVEVWRGIEGLGGVGWMGSASAVMKGKGVHSESRRGDASRELKGLERVGKELEVLEICLLGGDVDLSERRRRREEGRRAGRYRRRGEGGIHGSEMGMGGMSTPTLEMGMSGASLTNLELELQMNGPSTSIQDAAQAQSYTLTLPALTSLKATLDNATFFILSTWDLPVLRNLSVIAADFGYAGKGFKRFFEVHGGKVRQLELGHSSGEVEEWWVVGGRESLSDPHHPHNQHGHPHNPYVNPNNQPPDASSSPFAVALNTYCPNLIEFICCADAEWNWTSPDWIAPHVLMPRHEGLEVIGVRGLERRLRGDLGEAVGRRGGDVGAVNAQGGAGALLEDGVGAEGGEGEDAGGEGGMTLRAALRLRGLREDPYFMLLQQFGSLLRREAFPGLLKVRDMSPESDWVRRMGRMGESEGVSVGAMISSITPLGASGSTTRGANASTPRTGNPPVAGTSAPKKQTRDEVVARANGRIVGAFWERVVERCEVRGVVLEDWRGGEVRREALGNF